MIYLIGIPIAALCIYAAIWALFRGCALREQAQSVSGYYACSECFNLGMRPSCPNCGRRA